MPRALRCPPSPLHGPCPGTEYLWRQGRPWAANEHSLSGAEWVLACPAGKDAGPGVGRGRGDGNRMESAR